MKPSVKVLAYMALSTALLAASCGSPPTDEIAAEAEVSVADNELVGVWRITEARTFAQPDEGIEEQVSKDHRPGILIFTNNYFSWVDVHGDPVPDLPEEPTDAQLAAAYNQLTALAGTYEIQGSSITAPIIVSKNPNNMSSGEAFNLEFRFEDEILVFTLEAWNLEFKMKRLE